MFLWVGQGNGVDTGIEDGFNEHSSDGVVLGDFREFQQKRALFLQGKGSVETGVHTPLNSPRL